MNPTLNKPDEAIWKPLTGLPEGAAHWRDDNYEKLVEQWRTQVREITDRKKDRTILNIWLRERRRAFAIETGQIEGLYTLKRGVTEQLITEGLKTVVSSHTLENVDDITIKGLLDDQEIALNVVSDQVDHNRPLSQFMLMSWHRLLARHQATVSSLRVEGGRLQRVQVPFVLKGRYKRHPNNPRRQDGTVHEYCPPEHVQPEMDRLLYYYWDIEKQHIPTHVESAWLHHRFVRTHPFQDGNGRMSRLLMAYVYLKRGEIPPIITAEGKPAYIAALEIADRGNLKPFCDYIGALASVTMNAALVMTQKVLDNHRHIMHGNGGMTKDGKYYPPETEQDDPDREPGD